MKAEPWFLVKDISPLSCETSVMGKQMFLRKGGIKSLNNASHFALYVFDKLLGTVNQMLT